jgi:uncharacterized protein YecE (DUF72 family)
LVLQRQKNASHFQPAQIIPVLDAGIHDLLRERGYSLCVTDSDENPTNAIIATTPWGYLRLRRRDDTDADLSQWMEGILWQKWTKAFVFFKHEEEAKGPEMAMRFHELTDVSRGTRSRQKV